MYLNLAVHFSHAESMNASAIVNLDMTQTDIFTTFLCSYLQYDFISALCSL